MRISLTKLVQDLHIDNGEMDCVGQISPIRMEILPELVYRVNTVLIKMPAAFFLVKMLEAWPQFFERKGETGGFPQSDVKTSCRNFPGGPVAQTPHSPGQGPGWDPWSGN